MKEKEMKISENTAISMPMKNMLAIIAGVERFCSKLYDRIKVSYELCL